MTPDVTESLNDRVAGEIRAEMGRRQITGRRLADLLGVSHTWVHYRLTGSQAIDFVDVERIAAVLGVPVYQLIPAPETTPGGPR